MTAVAVSFDPLPRGVWLERYTVNGHRVVVSIDSRGEQVRLRTVVNNPDEIRAAIDDLWRDLDKADPVTTADFPATLPGHLRLI